MACGELEKVFHRKWEREGLKGLARREAEETRRAHKEQEKKQHQKDRQREKKREQKVRERERAKEKKSRERERNRGGEGGRGRDRGGERRAGASGRSPLKPPALTPKKTSPKHLRLETEGERWAIDQTLSDPADHHDWHLQLTVDLEASRDARDPVLEWVALGS